MKIFKKFPILIILLLTVLPYTGMAQNDPEPPPPDDTPIDGGLSLLLAAGAAYGVKKYRDGKKKQEGEGEDLKYKHISVSNI